MPRLQSALRGRGGDGCWSCAFQTREDEGPPPDCCRVGAACPTNISPDALRRRAVRDSSEEQREEQTDRTEGEREPALQGRGAERGLRPPTPEAQTHKHTNPSDTTTTEKNANKKAGNALTPRRLSERLTGCFAERPASEVLFPTAEPANTTAAWGVCTRTLQVPRLSPSASESSSVCAWIFSHFDAEGFLALCRSFDLAFEATCLCGPQVPLRLQLASSGEEISLTTHTLERVCFTSRCTGLSASLQTQLFLSLAVSPLSCEAAQTVPAKRGGLLLGEPPLRTTLSCKTPTAQTTNSRERLSLSLPGGV